MGDAHVKSSRRGLPHFFRKTNRPESSFSHSQILPHSSPEPELPEMPEIAPFGAPPDHVGSERAGSVSPVSVFDGEQHGQYTEPARYTPHRPARDNDNPTSYDLKPPPPSVSQTNMETLAQRFFSVDHLNIILRDQKFSHRFGRFLQQYRPSLEPLLKEYLETQKVAAAIEYANALAEQIHPQSGSKRRPAVALDEGFEERAQDLVEDLVSEALPAYMTHRMTQIVTESLVKEITGQGTPLMREMIPSLAEVYCVSDPSLPDNPIVYASEEFYNTSQYGKEYVIGRNCRFLQGPKTSTRSVKRMVEALAAGQELTETILNYRRDGTPFLNLLMIAPMYDNKGTVRYFLGCQIDVSPLIEGGRGLESFEHLLQKDRTDSRFGGRQERKPAEVLGELGAMFNEEELGTVKQKVLHYSEEPGRRTPPARAGRHGRRVLGMDEEGPSGRALWPSANLGPSGRLPGVYQNYLLVRPYPSLRITFTSPALRIPGLLQTKFMERIGGPSHVREGVLDALAHGTSVTAKISWLTNGPNGGSERGGLTDNKPRWIHCTPLLGSDEKVGVWMIVMVEHEEVTGQLNRGANSMSEAGGMSPRLNGAADARFTGDKLYQEYLRREGKSDAGSHVSKRSTEQPFRDF